MKYFLVVLIFNKILRFPAFAISKKKKMHLGFQVQENEVLLDQVA